jgi:SET domain-containing protein
MPQEPAQYRELTGGSALFDRESQGHEQETPDLTPHQVKICALPFAHGFSGIHRFGVYALEDIPADRIVIEYTGRRMSWAKASRVPFEKSIYIANLKRGYAVDGRIGGSGAEYVNHSCEPT